MDATMPDRGLPLSLWGIWWNAILLLRPAFSRLRTFMWFVTAVAGPTVRGELLGVTSIVRAARALHQAAGSLSQQRRQTRPAFGLVGASCAAAVPGPRIGQWPAGPGRGRHQSPQARQENAGRKAPASAIGIQHQARVHHGAFHAGCRLARTRGQERLLRAARRAHP